MKATKRTVRSRNTSANAMTRASCRSMFDMVLSAAAGASEPRPMIFLRQIVQRLDRRRAAPVDALPQALKMQVPAVVEDRVDERETHRAAEIAREIIEAGCILEPLRRQGAERDVVDRHHADHQPDAAENLRHEQLPEIPILRQSRSPSRCRRRSTAKPIPIITRGSSLRDRMPATGAITNMQAPVTNIVSPICNDE